MRKDVAENVATAIRLAGFDWAEELIFKRAAECLYCLGESGSTRDSQYTPDAIRILSAGNPSAAVRKHFDCLILLKSQKVSGREGIDLTDIGDLELSVGVGEDYRTIKIEDRFAAGNEGALLPNLSSRNRRCIEVGEQVELGCISGFSLPFGDRLFREQLAFSPDGWNDRWEDLERVVRPEGAVGQLGGFAYSEEAVDLRRDVIMSIAGRPELRSIDLFNSVEEIDYVLRRGPPGFLRNRLQIDDWESAVMRERNRVETIESILAVNRSWKLILRLDSSRKLGMRFGDYSSLFIFSETKPANTERKRRFCGLISR